MNEPSIDRVWELMESVRFCMFSTWNGSKLRSRPMGAFVQRQEGCSLLLLRGRGAQLGCGTMRMYGRGDFQPSGYRCRVPGASRKV